MTVDRFPVDFILDYYIIKTVVYWSGDCLNARQVG